MLRKKIIIINYNKCVIECATVRNRKTIPPCGAVMTLVALEIRIHKPYIEKEFVQVVRNMRDTKNKPT